MDTRPNDVSIYRVGEQNCKRTPLIYYKPYTTQERNIEIDTNQCVIRIMTKSNFIKPIKTVSIQL